MKSVQQGFGFGCGCVLFILFVVVVLPAMGISALFNAAKQPVATPSIVHLVHITPHPFASSPPPSVGVSLPTPTPLPTPRHPPFGWLGAYCSAYNSVADSLGDAMKAVGAANRYDWSASGTNVGLEDNDSAAASLALDDVPPWPPAAALVQANRLLLKRADAIAAGVSVAMFNRGQLNRALVAAKAPLDDLVRLMHKDAPLGIAC